MLFVIYSCAAICFISCFVLHFPCYFWFYYIVFCVICILFHVFVTEIIFAILTALLWPFPESRNHREPQSDPGHWPPRAGGRGRRGRRHGMLIIFVDVGFVFISPWLIFIPVLLMRFIFSTIIISVKQLWVGRSKRVFQLWGRCNHACALCLLWTLWFARGICFSFPLETPLIHPYWFFFFFFFWIPVIIFSLCQHFALRERMPWIGAQRRKWRVSQNRGLTINLWIREWGGAI